MDLSNDEIIKALCEQSSCFCHLQLREHFNLKIEMRFEDNSAEYGYLFTKLNCDEKGRDAGI